MVAGAAVSTAQAAGFAYVTWRWAGCRCPWPFSWLHRHWRGWAGCDDGLGPDWPGSRHRVSGLNLRQASGAGAVNHSFRGCNNRGGGSHGRESSLLPLGIRRLPATRRSLTQ